MSSFSSAQCENMVRDFWDCGHTQCPCDGTKLFARIYNHAMNYLLVLACPLCGKKAQVTRFSDPHRHQFRRWTPAECQDMVASFTHGETRKCPVCMATPHYETGAALQVIECPRCGNSAHVDGPAVQLPSASPVNAAA